MRVRKQKQGKGLEKIQSPKVFSALVKPKIVSVMTNTEELWLQATVSWISIYKTEAFFCVVLDFLSTLCSAKQDSLTLKPEVQSWIK